MHSNLGLLLRMLQFCLHVTHAGDDLQHLGVESIELLTLLKVFLLLGEITDDGGHTGHGLTQVIAGGLDGLTLQLQFCDDRSLTVSDGLELFQTDTPEVEAYQNDDGIGEKHPPRQKPMPGH